MAGRPKSRGERAQADKAGYRPARGGPPHPLRPPFEPGNTLAMRSGAWSPRRVGPLAQEKLAELLAAEWVPGRVKGPDCRADLEKLAQAQAQAQLMRDELDSMDFDGAVTPRRAGGTPPFLLWAEALDRASRLEEKLGIDGMSLHEEQHAASPDVEGNIEALAELGAQIVARHQAQG